MIMNDMMYYKNELYSLDNQRTYFNRKIITSVVNGDRLNGYNYIDEEERNKIFRFKIYADMPFIFMHNLYSDKKWQLYDTSEIIVDNDSYKEEIFYYKSKSDNELEDILCNRIIYNKKYKYNNIVNQENWGINGEVLSNNYERLEIHYYEGGNIGIKTYFIPTNENKYFLKQYDYCPSGGLYTLKFFYDKYMLFTMTFDGSGSIEESYSTSIDDYVPSFNISESKYDIIKYNYNKV